LTISGEGSLSLDEVLRERKLHGHETSEAAGRAPLAEDAPLSQSLGEDLKSAARPVVSHMAKRGAVARQRPTSEDEGRESAAKSKLDEAPQNQTDGTIAGVASQPQAGAAGESPGTTGNGGGQAQSQEQTPPYSGKSALAPKAATQYRMESKVAQKAASGTSAMPSAARALPLQPPRVARLCHVVLVLRVEGPATSVQASPAATGLIVPEAARPAGAAAAKQVPADATLPAEPSSPPAKSSK
jgi:hypothetical protein